MSQREELPSRTRVLIVGGGPVGLTASLLLSRRGISNVVVERRGDTQRAPAAHVLRTRSMQVFERIGVASRIRSAKPELRLDYVTWCSTLGGREVGRLDLRRGLGAGQEAWTNCPQNVLEPILLEAAKRKSLARIVGGAECIGIEEHDGGVVARIRRSDASESVVEADWTIAADGAASPTRDMLGIPMLGAGPQGRFFMVHFEADLSPALEGRSGPIFWILNPEASGTLIVHDPAKSHVLMTICSGVDGEEEALPSRLVNALGIRIDLRIVSIDSWSPHVQVAERYRQGRVFLAGDAAHRFPPTGGLGLNTGILDVDFLVHALAEVEAGRAAQASLDLYEAECRPVAEANAAESFENMLRLGEISKVLGSHADLRALEARLDTLSADERTRLAAAIEIQRSHFLSGGRLPRDPRRVILDTQSRTRRNES